MLGHYKAAHLIVGHRIGRTANCLPYIHRIIQRTALWGYWLNHFRRYF